MCIRDRAEVAQSERDKTIRTEQYRAEQDKARADADASYKLQEIENNKIVAEKNIELAKKEALVVEEKLVATVKKPADADKYKTEVQAEANKVKSIHEAEARAEALKIEAEARASARRIEAQAEADAIKAKGEAEADAIKARGIAEALAKDKLAEAMKKYGEAAAVSYTHLDASNELAADFIDFILSAQGQTIVEENKYIKSSDDAKEFTGSGKKGTIKPVSYTHLDVYKRQSQWSAPLRSPGRCHLSSL